MKSDHELLDTAEGKRCVEILNQALRTAADEGLQLSTMLLALAAISGRAISSHHAGVNAYLKAQGIEPETVAGANMGFLISLASWLNLVARTASEHREARAASIWPTTTVPASDRTH